ncbi:protein kinase [bacterium]|nr:protein kinase [bacterium]
MNVGPYEVLSELGRGGMGVVHRARAPDGRAVAVKVLRRSDEAAVLRFERERRLLATLGDAEGFVPLIDAGSTPSPWLAMPFLPGGTLRGRLEKGPLSSAQTVELARALASALARAHALGIVHRDVKPENVLFTEDGRTLVADLGIGKHFATETLGASRSVSLSASGELRGTAGYLAPEQIMDAKGVGPPADVFSLGAILHECLAGTPAFDGQSMLELLAKIESGRSRPLERDDAPAWLVRVVRRCLERDPARRFADGTALLAALDEGAMNEPARRGAFLALALVGVLALGGVAVFLSWNEPSPSSSPGEQEKTGAAKPRTGSPALAPAESRRKAEAARKSAEERARRGDVSGAIEEATRAIELGDTLALLIRGRLRAERRELEAAIADFSRALAIDPSLEEAWLNRGTCRLSRHEPALALADFTRAAELDPTDPKAWGNLAAVRVNEAMSRRGTGERSPASSGRTSRAPSRTSGMRWRSTRRTRRPGTTSGTSCATRTSWKERSRPSPGPSSSTRRTRGPCRTAAPRRPRARTRRARSPTSRARSSSTRGSPRPGTSGERLTRRRASSLSGSPT